MKTKISEDDYSELVEALRIELSVWYKALNKRKMTGYRFRQSKLSEESKALAQVALKALARQVEDTESEAPAERPSSKPRPGTGECKPIAQGSGSCQVNTIKQGASNDILSVKASETLTSICLCPKCREAGA